MAVDTTVLYEDGDSSNNAILPDPTGVEIKRGAPVASVKMASGKVRHQYLYDNDSIEEISFTWKALSEADYFLVKNASVFLQTLRYDFAADYALLDLPDTEGTKVRLHDSDPLLHVTFVNTADGIRYNVSWKLSGIDVT